MVKKRITKKIEAVQFNTGLQLVFTVMDFEIPSGTKATLFVRKPSGKFVYQEEDITVSGNVITIDLENQAITEHGTAFYQIKLKNGTDEITTFTGEIDVSKSLADAGAVESKTMIRAFDEAVSDKVAEILAKAELIAEQVIETIPEDYITMEAKVNELANAIKGNATGEVVFVDDISPVEHIPTVKVHGKNLLKPESGAAWQCTASIAADGKITLTNTETSGVAFARIGTLTLKKGRTYVYSRFDPTNIMNVLTWHTGTTIDSWYPVNGVPFTPTEDVTVDVAVYMSDISAVGKTASIYIQIEEAESATPYEPYIDPTTVTVTRCGRNLLPKHETARTNSGNGVTQKMNIDGSVTITGTATEPAYLGIDNIYNLTKGVYHVTGNTSAECLLIAGAYLGDTYVFEAQDRGEGVILDLTDKTFDHVRVMMYVPQGTTVSKTIYPMLSTDIGGKEYERPAGTSIHIPSSDGTVDGIISLSPNMTLLTDTAGMIVECEYNKDTNKVIRKIADALGITV